MLVSSQRNGDWLYLPNCNNTELRPGRVVITIKNLMFLSPSIITVRLQHYSVKKKYAWTEENRNYVLRHST